jgi:hypothetical protein
VYAAPVSPVGSGSAKYWTTAFWKWMLIYAASPLVFVLLVAIAFFPYLGVLIALVIGTAATIRTKVRPSK